MRRRRILAIALGIPVAAAGLLGLEIEIARRGPSLDGPPLDLDGIVGSRAEASQSVVWLGDSTAAGVGASSAKAALPQQLARATPGSEDLHILAVSGDRVGDVIEDQLGRVAGFQPDRIYISVGANDAIHLTSKADFRAGYRKLLDGLPRGVEVIALGVPDMGAPPRFPQPLRALAGLAGRRMDEVVREEARRAGATYVDIAGPTGPPFRRDTDRYFAADRYHPSDAGYGLWVKAITDQMGRG